MRKVLFVAVLISLTGSLVAAFATGIRIREFESKNAPTGTSLTPDPESGEEHCATPSTFRIGQVDDQFPIDRSTFQTAAIAAAQEWQDATGREWFRFSDDGEIVLNLLYDGRQEELTRQSEAQARIEARIADLRERHSGTDVKARSIESAVRIWREKESRLLERMTGYQETARELRARGDISPEAAAFMERERADLLGLSREVEIERINLQAEVEEISGAESGLQRSKEEIAEELSVLRQSFPERTFVEGQHLRQGPIHEITIYTYQSPEELHLVLLHEFGHALGLGHSTLPGSVMNPTRRLGIGDFHLSAPDVIAAAAICPDKSN